MDILALADQFGGFVWMLAAFVVALSIIVAVHEYGHYIVGRWSGIQADVFSLGFGPVLVSRMDRHGTRWQIAALPLGGYVKFRGDDNAASAKDIAAIEALPEEERRHTMHGAPLWARTATVAAGPVFNFIMSILIFAGVVLFTGTVKEPLTIQSIAPVPMTQELRPGDQVLGVAGQLFAEDDSLSIGKLDLPETQVMGWQVLRAGREITVTAPHPMLAVVGSVAPRSAADEAGLRRGDLILTVNDMPNLSFSHLKKVVEASDGAPVRLGLWRAEEEVEVTLLPRRVDEPQDEGGFATEWRIGIVSGLFFEPETERPGIWRALGLGAAQVGKIVTSSLSGLKHMITGAISSCNLSGPLGIAETSASMAAQGTQSFIWFIAVLSTAVGLLNLFPIPALDGGHLVFYAYEALTGKPPSDRAMQVLMSLGVALILTLMLFALANDIFCP